MKGGRKEGRREGRRRKERSQESRRKEGRKASTSHLVIQQLPNSNPCGSKRHQLLTSLIQANQLVTGSPEVHIDAKAGHQHQHTRSTFAYRCAGRALLVAGGVKAVTSEAAAGAASAAATAGGVVAVAEAGGGAGGDSAAVVGPGLFAAACTTCGSTTGRKTAHQRKYCAVQTWSIKPTATATADRHRNTHTHRHTQTHGQTDTKAPTSEHPQYARLTVSRLADNPSLPTRAHACAVARAAKPSISLTEQRRTHTQHVHTHTLACATRAPPPHLVEGDKHDCGCVEAQAQGARCEAPSQHCAEGVRHAERGREKDPQRPSAEG